MQIPFVDLKGQSRAIRQELLDAVDRVLQHGQFILGPEVTQLEERLALQLEIEHVIAVNSGTDALLLGLRALGIGPGDEVLTVSHSFFATAAAICMVGATPVFVDVQAESMLMNPLDVERAATAATKAVLPVHLNGHCCDMDQLASLCARRGWALVEDAAQAFGAQWRHKAAGTYGLGCFSLHPLKVLNACGDGGLVAVADAQLAITLRRFRNLGLRDRDHACLISGNSRLDTLHASMILAKLNHLDAWQAARASLAAQYRNRLQNLVTLPPSQPECQPNYSIFVVRHPQRDALRAHLAKDGIDTRIHYPVPIHRQEAYARYHRRPLPETERVVASCLSLPLYPTLHQDQMDHICTSIETFCRQHPM